MTEKRIPAWTMTPEQERDYLNQGMADAVEPADGGVGIMTDSGPRWYLERMRESLAQDAPAGAAASDDAAPPQPQGRRSSTE
ncbi:MAG: hypothetical protein Q4G34_02715 [Micrococcus sp.]|nr:hypothetical protein [Micrococcus sp.]